MKLSHRKAFMDWHRPTDRLNPRRNTPRQDRREDNLRLLWRATVAAGLCVLAVDLWIKLISGDLA